MYEKARRIAGLWLSGRLSDLVFLFSILLSHPTLFAIERVNAADALREAFHLLKSLFDKCRHRSDDGVQGSPMVIVSHRTPKVLGAEPLMGDG